MSPEVCGPREFAKFVSYHLFRDVDRLELFSVVNREGESNELRWNVAVACPCLQNFLLAFLDHFGDLAEKLLVDVWAFLEGAGHKEDGEESDESEDSEEGGDARCARIYSLFFLILLYAAADNQIVAAVLAAACFYAESFLTPRSLWSLETD